MSYPHLPHKRKQEGFVLIASLLMLVVLSLLAVSLYHNFTIQENVASNTKEKGRAFQIAQSTLQYGEYALLQGGSKGLPTAVSCASTTQLSAFTICTTSVNIATPTTSGATLNLANGMTYGGPSGMTYSTTGGNSTFYAKPQYYIQYLGAAPGGLGQIYQVTALGYGATQNAVAVVQSTYELSSGVKNLGGL